VDRLEMEIYEETFHCRADCSEAGELEDSVPKQHPI
jgi:hypothetical protein